MSAFVTSIAGTLSVLASVALLVPSAVVFVQTLAYFFGRKSTSNGAPPAALSTLRVVVLMPAHDEESVIAHTLHKLEPELEACVSVLVVADNCSDATAAIAQAAGARVVERADTLRRGKGYALDFGLRLLESDPPDVVVVIDADCEVSRGGVLAMATEAAASGRPVQARNLMQLPPEPSLTQRVAALAWLVKTEVRVIGSQNLGWPCNLMGTGMALPWKHISAARLASGNLTEDVQLGIDLAVDGAYTSFFRGASVTSHFPVSQGATETQRTRWEHGHLATARTQVSRLLREGLRQRRVGLVAMALDLTVPPLALLTSAVFGLGLVQVVVGALLGLWGGLLLTICCGSMLFGAILASWWARGRGLLSAAQLMAVPGYVAVKIPMYLRVLIGRGESRWVRTARDTRDDNHI